MSQPWIVIMPEGWKPGTCVCDKCFGNCVRTDDCPLDNAKKAVEASNEQIKIAGYMMSVTPGPIIDGKPVTLYAVEAEK